MKLRNILIASLVATSLASCEDYLEVETPSRFDFDYVYSSKDEMSAALKGIYAKAMSGNAYGQALIMTFQLNSDIDFVNSSGVVGTTHNNYRRLECDDEGSEGKKLWDALYESIEHANIFIDQVKKSDFYADGDEECLQMYGEAVALRAIFYHDLVWYFGDIPFSLEPSYNTKEIFPVVDRHEVLDTLIKDLKAASAGMKFANELKDMVERPSKELAWGLIARLAMTCGGYSLMPDKNNPMSYGKMERLSNYRDYYDIAREYCDSVMTSGTHSLAKDYSKVFVDECTNGITPDASDDVMFEWPFGESVSGCVGYQHGNACEISETGSYYNYGEIKGGAKVSALAKYMFDTEDVRRDYIFGLWKYNKDGEPIFEPDAYANYNNKWSKMWSSSPLGKTSTGSTGFNYPYMRYTDVLLMYAEAVNELENGVNGPNGETAKNALRQVRERAFRGAVNAGDKVDGYIARMSVSKDRFLKAVLDERKFEFAGENMRWRDLVRNNIYNEVLMYTFLRYAGVAEVAGASYMFTTPSAYASLYDTENETDEKWDNIPALVYTHKTDFSNLNVESFPNKSVRMLHIFNMYGTQRPESTEMGNYIMNAMYGNWISDTAPKGDLCYSLAGYVYSDDEGKVYIMRDGNAERIDDIPSTLPVARYIIPYPRQAIQDATGSYVNYYGY